MSIPQACFLQLNFLPPISITYLQKTESVLGTSPDCQTAIDETHLETEPSGNVSVLQGLTTQLLKLFCHKHRRKFEGPIGRNHRKVYGPMLKSHGF
jgi:hypothetical protein